MYTFSADFSLSCQNWEKQLTDFRVIWLKEPCAIFLPIWSIGYYYIRKQKMKNLDAYRELLYEYYS